MQFFKLLDPLKIYEFEYWMYVFTGCWNYTSLEQWKTVLYKFYQIIVVLIYTVAVVFYVMDAIAVKDDLDKLSFNMSSSFLLFITIGKVLLFFKEKNNLEGVHIRLENHLYLKTIGVSEEDKVILRKKAEMLSSITITFYTLVVLGLPLRVIADTTFENREYLIPIPNRERVESYYGFVYAPQVIVMLHFLTTVLSHDLLVFSVLIRLIAHYEILTKNFQKITALYPKKDFEKYMRTFANGVQQKKIINDVLLGKRNESEKFLGNYAINSINVVDSVENKKLWESRAHEILRQNINHHQVLLRETLNFGRLYSSPLFVQACGVGILIGIVILQIIFISRRITILLIEQIIFTGTLLCNIYYLCTFASELSTKSIGVANELYGTPWYEMDIKNKRLVHFAIQKLMKAPKLKGGGMIVINRVTYLKFLRISYNLIAVLRNIY